MRSNFPQCFFAGSKPDSCLWGVCGTHRQRNESACTPARFGREGIAEKGEMGAPSSMQALNLENSVVGDAERGEENE